MTWRKPSVIVPSVLDFVQGWVIRFLPSFTKKTPSNGMAPFLFWISGCCLPTDSNGRFRSCTIWDRQWLSDGYLYHLGLGVVLKNVFARFNHQGLFQLETRKADEPFQVFRQLSIVYGMCQIFITGSQGKIQPEGHVQNDRLLIGSLVRECSDDAVEGKVLQGDFTGFDYHTKRTTAPAMEAPARPNHRLRADA